MFVCALKWGNGRNVLRQYVLSAQQCIIKWGAVLLCGGSYIVLPNVSGT